MTTNNFRTARRTPFTTVRVRTSGTGLRAGVGEASNLGAVLFLGCVGFLFWLAEWWTGAIAASSCALAGLYAAQDRTGAAVWRGNPVRALIPAFLLFQLLGWARAEMVLLTRDLLDYTWMWVGYSPETAAQACAEYLLVHLVYFLAVHVVFRTVKKPLSLNGIVQERAVLAAWPVLLLAGLGFLVTYGRENQFAAPVLYVTTNIMRFRLLFTLIVIRVGMARNGLGLRFWSWSLFLAMLGIAITIVVETKMRFVVLQTIAGMVVVWMIMRRRKVRLLRLAGWIPLAVAGLLGFVVITDIKNNREVTLDRIGIESAVRGADALMFRGASFHADAVLLEKQSLQGLFRNQQPQLLKEILAGIPMSGFITDRWLGKATNLDMQFQWSINGNYAESSYFVSAPTSLRYGYGGAAMLVGALLAGLAHGLAFKYSSQRACDWSWVANHAVALPVALHGLQRGDLIGLVVNLALFSGVLHLLQVRMSARNASPLYRSGVATR